MQKSMKSLTRNFFFSNFRTSIWFKSLLASVSLQSWTDVLQNESINIWSVSLMDSINWIFRIPDYNSFLIILLSSQIHLRLGADDRRFLDGEISCDMPPTSSLHHVRPAACRSNNWRALGREFLECCAFCCFYENPLLHIPEKWVVHSAYLDQGNHWYSLSLHSQRRDSRVSILCYAR